MCPTDGERLRPDEHSDTSPETLQIDDDEEERKSGRASRHFGILAQAAFVDSSSTFVHGTAGAGERVMHRALAPLVANRKNHAIILLVASLSFVTHKIEQG
jgi:hypothetical protein